jgi:hypothetical protein
MVTLALRRSNWASGARYASRSLSSASIAPAQAERFISSRSTSAFIKRNQIPRYARSITSSTYSRQLQPTPAANPASSINNNNNTSTTSSSTPSPAPSRLASNAQPTSNQNTPIQNISKTGFSDEPLSPDPENYQKDQVDWTKSYHGLSAEAFSKEAIEILLNPLDEEDVEIKPDGIVYLPEIKYRRILNKSFGPGAWGLVPRGESIVTAKTVTREYALVIHGRYVFSLNPVQTKIRSTNPILDSSLSPVVNRTTFPPTVSLPRQKAASPTPWSVVVRI